MLTGSSGVYVLAAAIFGGLFLGSLVSAIAARRSPYASGQRLYRSYARILGFLAVAAPCFVLWLLSHRVLWVLLIMPVGELALIGLVHSISTGSRRISTEDPEFLQTLVAADGSRGRRGVGATDQSWSATDWSGQSVGAEGSGTTWTR